MREGGEISQKGSSEESEVESREGQGVNLGFGHLKPQLQLSDLEVIKKPVELQIIIGC